MIKISSKVLLISVERKPYDFNGRQGISTKGSLIQEGTVYPFKIESDELYDALKSVIQKDGEAVMELRANRDGVNLVLTSFHQEKKAA